MINTGDKVKVLPKKEIAEKFHNTVVTVQEFHCNHDPVLYGCITDRGQQVAFYEDEIELVNSHG